MMIQRFLLGVILLLLPTFTLTQDNSQYRTENVSYSMDALNRLYIVGLQYLNNGDLTQAEISFRSILAFPYRSEDWRTTRYYKGKAHFYLGDIYFIQKKYLKASTNYQEVVQEYGEIEEYTSSLFKLGRSLILGEKAKEGIQVLRDYNYNYGIQEGLADNALYWIARGYMTLDNYTAALKILNQILRDYPQSPMAYDIRILIAKLETEYLNTPATPLKNKLNVIVSVSQQKAEKIEKEKILIDRIKQLLNLKEQLLSIKEKKLKLLDKISKTRAKAIRDKRLYIDPNSENFWE